MFINNCRAPLPSIIEADIELYPKYEKSLFPQFLSQISQNKYALLQNKNHIWKSYLVIFMTQCWLKADKCIL